MTPPLWGHQKEALSFAEGKPAVMLAMAMRTGKSRVVVELLQQRLSRNVLIVCPASVIDVWPEQFREFAPSFRSVLPLRKGTISKRTDLAATIMSLPTPENIHIVVINYEAVWREPFAAWALAQTWDALVCDEIHRAKAAGGKASRFLARLAKQVPLRIGLTGTPFHHEIFDIYGQYRILDPTIYAAPGGHVTIGYVKQRYGNWLNLPGLPVPILNKKDPYKNQEEFMERFRRIAYEVDASVLHLPDPTFTPLGFDLSPKGRRVYKDLEKDFFAEVDEGEITASNAMVKALRLQQVTSGYGRINGTDVCVDETKRKLLADLFEDIDEPVVVFCRFHHDLDAVMEVAHKFSNPICELSGRKNQLAEWQANGPKILAVQIQAGGVGIDLSRARIAIYYSLGLSLGDYEQSLARLQASGQTWPIGYYYLLANGTIDWKVYHALRARKEVIEELIKR